MNRPTLTVFVERSYARANSRDPGPPHVNVRPVTLHIAGESIGIRTDASDAQLEALAARVESCIDAIRGGKGGAPNAKVFLLAAIALAEELRETEESREELEGELERLRNMVHGHVQGALDFLDDADAGAPSP